MSNEPDSAARTPQHLRILARVARVAWAQRRAEAERRRAGHRCGPESVLLIVGCQRSGTTLMTRIFDADPHAKVYPEQSALSWRDRDEHLRLAPLAGVRRAIERSRFPLVVLKPLVESQHTPKMLGALANARAVWMVRHYADVAASNLQRFGRANGLRNLRRALASGGAPGGDWRGEGASPETLAWLRARFSEQMDPWDAAALFWVLRNQLYFDLELEAHPRVRMLHYEALVADPAASIRALYDFVGRPDPGAAAVASVRASSVGKGREIELSPDVRARCDAMWERLCAVRAQVVPCASSS